MKKTMEWYHCDSQMFHYIFQLGYFCKVVDDYLIVLTINWKIIYPVYFITVFKLMASVLYF